MIFPANTIVLKQIGREYQKKKIAIVASCVYMRTGGLAMRKNAR